MSEIIIREIVANDNIAIAKLIRDVLIELGAPKVGTAYEDTSLDELFHLYNSMEKAVYFILEIDSVISGGVGISNLNGFDGEICELQKMYISPNARNKGLGAKMINTCFLAAKKMGYKKCYLETLPYMKSAIRLYENSGFKSLNAPLGNTGHYSCTEWMLKDLQ